MRLMTCGTYTELARSGIFISPWLFLHQSEPLAIIIAIINTKPILVPTLNHNFAVINIHMYVPRLHTNFY